MRAIGYIANFQYKIELADRASSIYVLRLDLWVKKIELLSPKLRNMAKPAIDVALNNSSIDELLSPKPRTMTMSEDHVALLSNSIDELLNPKTATPIEGRLQPLNSNSISLAKLLKEICVRA